MHNGINLSMTQCPNSSNEWDIMIRILYALAIGSIIYTMTCTHPDVSYSFSMLSRYRKIPGRSHWIVVKNILKYLRILKTCFLYMEVNKN